jgi:hypothetical protein
MSSRNAGGPYDSRAAAYLSAGTPPHSRTRRGGLRRRRSTGHEISVEKARATKNFDFLLNVIALWKEPLQLAAILEKLGYKAFPESRNFQFEKPIPASAETMRIEFMAPDEYKHEKDFRVDIREGVHARACTGGSIALVQSHRRKLSGKLPDGDNFATEIRVTQPHALVMLKLLA